MSLNFYIYLAQIVIGIVYIVFATRLSGDRPGAIKWHRGLGVFWILIGTAGVAFNVFWAE